MNLISVVIPALNEEHNLAPVMATVPHEPLAELGWEVEVVVVDNASTDNTAAVAASLGARVVHQPERGYGNAYKAGFASARGELVVTGDADRTYPFDHVPAQLETFLRHDLEFMTMNRLLASNRAAMKRSHEVANHALSLVNRTIFGNDVIDSQSGMWMFTRQLWQRLDVRSGGMAFSQEIKNEAWLRSQRCLEIPVEYRPRGGEVKLHALRDGVRNGLQMFGHRLRGYRDPQLTGADPAVARMREYYAGRDRRSFSHLLAGAGEELEVG